jgi:hypothetical protein
MEWVNLKDQWPRANSIIVACYLDTISKPNLLESWVMNEKSLDRIPGDRVYWTYLPEELEREYNNRLFLDETN